MQSSAVALKKMYVPQKINVGASEWLKNNLMKKLRNFTKLNIDLYSDCHCRVDIQILHSQF